ncbi:MAG TPA: HAD family hydrolase [bacterium]|nr:HAD family hydrolase [bacterium]HPP29984.1 HAD family hydrolase [bacterium]
MKYKLIALDLDGTLLSDDGTIPEENIKQLVKFSQSGGIVVLSSGRMTDCIVPFAEVLGIDCPVIAYNGAMVRLKKVENRRIIYHNPLPSRASDEIIDYCIKHRFFLNFYLDDVLYADESEELRKYAEIYSRQTGAVYHFIRNISLMKGKSPTKLILITDVENEARFRTRDFQYEYFFGYFHNKQVKIIKTNPEYLEFINGSTDKGVALKKISEYYNIAEEQIISMGDGNNDIDMFKYSGISAVPSNAKEEVKKYADVILPWDNNSAAVGNFLREIL